MIKKMYAITINRYLPLFWIGLQLLPSAGFAQLSLPLFFKDQMVLQQNDSVAIWGWDLPETKIQMTTSWGEKTYAIAENDGKWRIKIKTPAASFGQQDITIQGSTMVRITNVLIGEVWFCSGQSNMEMPMKGLGKSKVTGSLEFIQNGTNPYIRLFNTERAGSLAPVTDVSGSWSEANKKSISNFSAVGYLFAKKLYEKLNVPIGIIEASWGGTRIEAWMPKAAALEYKDINIPTELSPDPSKRKYPTQIYNGMIHAFQDYTIKGMLWYQGETNRANPKPYRGYLETLIEAWRSQWNNPQLPFYIVQIAPYAYEKYRKTPWMNAALIRAAQLKASLELPNTALVVTTDVGSCADIHPPDKEPISERLALLALHGQYGYKEIQCTSPILDSIKVKGDQMVLSFKSVLNGSRTRLSSSENSIQGLTISGVDKVFYPALAHIDKNGTLIVQSDKIKKPVAVRYGFIDCFEGNLYGPSNLPVSPFRTDNW